MNSIIFVVRPSAAAQGKLAEIIPRVDGSDLTHLATRFEAERGFAPIGGYGGIIPAWFAYGPLRDYYLGAVSHRYWGPLGRIAVLGCGGCGEVGCWPLYAEVQADEKEVTWRNLEQPHRRDRDYSTFGPFRFDRQEYESELIRLGDLEASGAFGFG